MNQRFSSSPGRAIFTALAFVFLLQAAVAAGRRPNVVIILTDDQGYAELGVTGNPIVHTPNIDHLASQSATLANFYVMPVCSPTRAGLMTGRYYYRTGLTDTWLGRSLMDPAETTVAQMFAAAGYRTGIFGKWHLGDNYPRRPMDRGFQESLVLNGGGLAQPGDPPDPVDERGAYFNATLCRNGAWMKTDGYVSDVLTTAAIQFVETNQARPFFLYLPFNCPHAPHQVPDDYRRHYPASLLDPTNFPEKGHPMPARQNFGDIARVYGMVENIDDNVGRLIAKLDELKLTPDTIVVLFSDNGCQQHNGYNGGLRSWKGSVFEGGIRQFCFIRWPGQIKAGRRVDQISSHLDLAPTLLDFCGVAKPEPVKFDGRSLAPLLRAEPVQWPDRLLFSQWHRGDAPERYRNAAVRSQDWKLVQPLGAGDNWGGRTDFQLYDMVHDPMEMHNVAAANPERVAALKAAYDKWFDDITGARDFSAPQRIYLGTTHENPVLLTRQDWRGPHASWSPDGIGYWEVNVITAARYDIKFRFDPANAAGEARLAYGGVNTSASIKQGAEECMFRDVQLSAGPGRLEATLREGADTLGVKYVEVNRLD